MIAEVNRNKKKRSKPFSVEDFMPQAKEKKMPSKRVVKALKHINAILGGEEK